MTSKKEKCEARWLKDINARVKSVASAVGCSEVTASLTRKYMVIENPGSGNHKDFTYILKSEFSALTAGKHVTENMRSSQARSGELLKFRGPQISITQTGEITTQAQSGLVIIRAALTQFDSSNIKYVHDALADREFDLRLQASRIEMVANG